MFCCVVLCLWETFKDSSPSRMATILQAKGCLVRSFVLAEKLYHSVCLSWEFKIHCVVRCYMKCSYLSLPFCVFSHNWSSCLLCDSYSLLFVRFHVRDLLVSRKHVMETDGEATSARKWQFPCNISFDGLSNSLWREEGPSVDSDWSRDTDLASRNPQCAIHGSHKTHVLVHFHILFPLETWIFWISTSFFFFLPFCFFGMMMRCQELQKGIVMAGIPAFSCGIYCFPLLNSFLLLSTGWWYVCNLAEHSWQQSFLPMWRRGCLFLTLYTTSGINGVTHGVVVYMMVVLCVKLLKKTQDWNAALDSTVLYRILGWIQNSGSGHVECLKGKYCMML